MTTMESTMTSSAPNSSSTTQGRTSRTRRTLPLSRLISWDDYAEDEFEDSSDSQIESTKRTTKRQKKSATQNLPTTLNDPSDATMSEKTDDNTKTMNQSTKKRKRREAKKPVVDDATTTPAASIATVTSTAGKPVEPASASPSTPLSKKGAKRKSKEEKSESKLDQSPQPPLPDDSSSSSSDSSDSEDEDPETHLTGADATGVKLKRPPKVREDPSPQLAELLASMGDKPLSATRQARIQRLQQKVERFQVWQVKQNMILEEKARKNMMLEEKAKTKEQRKLKLLKTAQEKESNLNQEANTNEENKTPTVNQSAIPKQQSTVPSLLPNQAELSASTAPPLTSASPPVAAVSRRLSTPLVAASTFSTKCKVMPSTPTKSTKNKSTPIRTKVDSFNSLLTTEKKSDQEPVSTSTTTISQPSPSTTNDSIVSAINLDESISPQSKRKYSRKPTISQRPKLPPKPPLIVRPEVIEDIEIELPPLYSSDDDDYDMIEDDRVMDESTLEGSPPACRLPLPDEFDRLQSQFNVLAQITRMHHSILAIEDTRKVQYTAHVISSTTPDEMTSRTDTTNSKFIPTVNRLVSIDSDRLPVVLTSAPFTPSTPAPQFAHHHRTALPAQLNLPPFTILNSLIETAEQVFQVETIEEYLTCQEEECG